MQLMQLAHLLVLTLLLRLADGRDQDGRSRQYRTYHGQQDCETPHGLRQVLCSRDDTSIMCRFFDAQSEGAAFQLPSLGSGVTIFVMVDAAVSRVKYMSRSSPLAQAIRALSANEISDSKRISMRMYLQLEEPLDREELVHRQQVPTALSRALRGAEEFSLTFTQTGDGQVEITSLSRMSRARILDSFEICDSWIHTVDGLILPAKDNDLNNIPDFKLPQEPATSPTETSQDDQQSLIIASGLIGGIAVILGTLCFQWSWAKVWQTGILPGSDRAKSGGRISSANPSAVLLGNSQEGSGRTPGGSDESEFNLQDSVDRAVASAMEKWTGGSTGWGNNAPSTLGSPRAKRSLEAAEGQAVKSSLSSSLTQGLVSLGESGDGLLPIDAHPPPPSKSFSSAEEGPSVPVRRLIPGEDPYISGSQHGTASKASSASGPVSARLIQELVEAEQMSERSEVSDSEEVTWETVQGVFDRVHDRSWQLLGDDLTVCLRPDGTDWVLGAIGYGRVYKGILHGIDPCGHQIHHPSDP
ncbi:hypothetical protein WJX84_002837 [Apatococcus fuscideae]|uniref:Uncharacterized protein n=1 Tax=Apatococcus fuscideae TaxID=2026836 RepID=A0AAW1SH57_9CHLO